MQTASAASSAVPMRPKLPKIGADMVRSWQRKIKELLAPAFNLKAHKQLPILRAALLRHQQALLGDQPIASKNLAA